MSHRICKTAKELSEAIKEETDVIEVEGDLSNKIVRIKVTGKVAWAVCAVSLAAAISFAIAAGATAAVPPVGGAHLVGFTAAMGTSAKEMLRDLKYAVLNGIPSEETVRDEVRERIIEYIKPSYDSTLFHRDQPEVDLRATHQS